MNNYFPKSNIGQLNWLVNFRNKIATYELELGLNENKLVQFQQLSEKLITALNEVEVAKVALQKELDNKEIVLKNQLNELLHEVEQLKTIVSHDRNIAQELRLGKLEYFDSSTYKPKIDVEALSEFVQINFEKGGVDALNIFKRKNGEYVWKFIAKVSQSPYDDYNLNNISYSEKYEYQAYGVVEDQEIGIPSDIVNVAYRNKLKKSNYPLMV